MSCLPNCHRLRAFTLIELLVVVAVIGVLISVLLPALRSARESTRAIVCGSKLRQIAHASLEYAQENDGLSPALGVPWGKPPFWALVVQQWAEVEGETAGELYKEGSLLVCPSGDLAHPLAMERTYAINVTGHAGLDDDPKNFDEQVVHIRVDKVRRPSAIAFYVDSDAAPDISGAPPSTRTPATIDFRQPSHIDQRLGRYHAGGRFQAAHFDGSVGSESEVAPAWTDPLP
jgi:prepilin-type N-terminal cleavage/methylation domain-containing protein